MQTILRLLTVVVFTGWTGCGDDKRVLPMDAGIAAAPDADPTPGTIGRLVMFGPGSDLLNAPMGVDGSGIHTETDLTAAKRSCALTSETYQSSTFGALRFETGVPEKALFGLSTGKIDGNGVSNPVFAMGYNTTARGGKFKLGENSLAWYMEADWHDGTNRTMELYGQYESADGEREIRPIFFMFDRNRDRLINAVIRGEPLNIQNDLGEPAMEIGTGLTNLYSRYLYLKDAEANVTGEKNVYLRAGGSSDDGSLYLGAAKGGSVSIQTALGETALQITAGYTRLFTRYILLTDDEANIIGQRNVYIKAGDANAAGNLYLGAGRSGSVYLETGNSPVRVCVQGCETRFGGNTVVDGAVQIGGPGGPKWLSGAGSPEGVVACRVGCLYTRTDGGPGATLYVKETGTGTTGWAAK